MLKRSLLKNRFVLSPIVAINMIIDTFLNTNLMSCYWRSTPVDGIMESGNESWAHKMPEMGGLLIRNYLVQCLYLLGNPQMPQQSCPIWRLWLNKKEWPKKSLTRWIAYIWETIMRNSKSDSLSSPLKKFPVISDILITMCVFIQGEAKVTVLERSTRNRCWSSIF